MLDSLERLTCAVEAARADIAPTYAEYLQLALAIATDCGEAGRACFHRLCALSPKYRREHAEKMFTNVLRSGRGQVHLGTAFHLAEQAGVTIPAPNPAASVSTVSAFQPTLTHTREAEAEFSGEAEGPADNGEVLLPGSEPLQALPLFADARWPEFIATVLSVAQTRAQRDALLLGLFTVLGASLERYVRCPYGGRLLSPCLQTFIVAPPASGKGVLSLLRLLVEPIHNELRGRFERQMATYRKEKIAYDALGKERSEKEPPEKPQNRMFLIAGNNSGTGILQNLMDADGTGLILETEADTISAAIGADYGHWSDTLRKAFDHERLSYNRRMDQEYREVRKSYLSVLLSGTPAQVKPLIPSAENGLFSRQLFYYMPGIREWQNQFDSNDRDLETLFTALGKEWKQRLDVLKQQGLFTLRLTDRQKQLFNERFAGLFHRAGFSNGHEMNSSVARLAINTCRILSVVAMLRGDFKPAADLPSDNLKDGIITRWDLPVSEEDFEAVMSLVEPLYRHATHILTFLPSTEVSRRSNSECDSFFATLSPRFSREELSAKADELGINKNTARTWLRRMLKKGSIEHDGQKEEYRKKM